VFIEEIVALIDEPRLKTKPRTISAKKITNDQKSLRLRLMFSSNGKPSNPSAKKIIPRIELARIHWTGDR
jgi:hypothetical protein